MGIPSSKAEYYELSRSMGLPARCPMLARCERRAHTIALANDWPLEEAGTRIGLAVPVVKSIGAGAYRIGGSNNFVFGGQCPEVNLFEETVALIGFSGIPTTKGVYDRYFTGEKFRVSETGHFSQCAEYVTGSSNNEPAPKQTWIKQHYQWAVATAIAAVGTVAALMALK